MADLYRNISPKPHQPRANPSQPATVVKYSGEMLRWTVRLVVVLWWCAAFTSIGAAFFEQNPWLLVPGILISACLCRSRPGSFFLVSGGAVLLMGTLSVSLGFSSGHSLNLDFLLVHAIFFFVPAARLLTHGYVRARSGMDHAPPGLADRIIETALMAWPFRALSPATAIPDVFQRSKHIGSKAFGWFGFFVAVIAFTGAFLGASTDLDRSLPWCQALCLGLAAAGSLILINAPIGAAPALGHLGAGLFFLGWALWRSCWIRPTGKTIDLFDVLIPILYLTFGLTLLRSFARSLRQTGKSWSIGPLAPNLRLIWGRPATVVALVIFGLATAIGLYYRWENQPAASIVRPVASAFQGPLGTNQLTRDPISATWEGFWVRSRFFYRSMLLQTGVEPSSLNLINSIPWRRLRQQVHPSQLRWSQLGKPTPVTQLANSVPALPLIRSLVETAGLNVLVDAGLVEDFREILELRVPQNLSPGETLKILLEKHNVLLFRSDSGATLRLLSQYSGAAWQHGSNYWLKGATQIPISREQLFAAGENSSELLLKAKQPVASNPQTFKIDEGLALSKVLGTLAKGARFNVVIDPLVTNTLSACQLTGRPEELFTDLVELFGLGQSWDPALKVIFVRANPFLPATQVSARLAQASSSVQGIRAASKAFLPSPRDLRSVSYTADPFMGPVWLAPPVLTSMSLLFQLSGNAALLEGRTSDALEDLASLEHIIEYCQQIPFLETWGQFVASTASYVDVALCGVENQGWNEVQLRRMIAFLDQLHPAEELKLRMANEKTRVATILTSFPHETRLQTLVQLDRDPANPARPAERFQIGLETLLTSACPKAWLLRNAAQSAEYLDRVTAAAFTKSRSNQLTADTNAVRALEMFLSKNGDGPGRWHPYRFLADRYIRVSAPLLHKSLLSDDWELAQKGLADARTACGAALLNLQSTAPPKK